LIRRQFRMKARAAILIQSHVRRMIAQKRYTKFKYEQRHRLEALRMRDQEERQLKKSGNKRYKEVAEQHYRERLLDMERKEREVEVAGRKQLEDKRLIIKTAANKADEPVDIDDIVEGIFGFLPTDSGSGGGDAPPPSAFSVIHRSSHLIQSQKFI